jgi:3,4-dihydroxyphenylacetate 2,3-dioxygenase
MPIAAAAVVSHQPGIMMPDEKRQALPTGDYSLIKGFEDMRRRLLLADVDILVILDTHWFSTTETIVAGADAFRGTYTSEELPTLINNYEYDYPGAPELAAMIKKISKEQRVPCVSATSPNLPLHYPTINLVHWLRREELQNIPVLSVSCCQTAEDHNFLAFGRVLAEAAQRSGQRVAVLASGGMSHTFPRLDNIWNGENSQKEPENVLTPEARAKDEQIIKLWAEGSHQQVLAGMPSYHPFKPEGFFGHYLTMLGAIGGEDCTAKGVQLSNYENALGTGQVHVWFELSQKYTTCSSGSGTVGRESGSSGKLHAPPNLGSSHGNKDEVVVVTGCSGYLGSVLVQTLCERGYTVRGTVRSLTNEQKVAHLRTVCPPNPPELFEADLLVAGSFAKAFEGATVVMHTASPFHAAGPDVDIVKSMIEPAVRGTMEVMRAAAASPSVRRVVLTSSGVAVLDTSTPPPSPNTKVYDESDWNRNEHPSYPRYESVSNCSNRSRRILTPPPRRTPGLRH